MHFGRLYFPTELKKNNFDNIDTFKDISKCYKLKNIPFLTDK